MPLEEDTERAQFIMKLAPRIRRLETDTISCLTLRLESVLKRLQQRREGNPMEEQSEGQSSGQEEVRRKDSID
jgi:hypothetical protein